MEAHDIWVSDAQKIGFNLGTIWFKFSALDGGKGMRTIQVSYTGVMPRDPAEFPERQRQEGLRYLLQVQGQAR